MTWTMFAPRWDMTRSTCTANPTAQRRSRFIYSATASHVRTMTLEGVTLLDVPMFERLPRSSQEALDLLLARCQADPACHAAYPNLRAELDTVISRVEKQPVDLGVTNPQTGQPVTLNRDMLVLGTPQPVGPDPNGRPAAAPGPPDGSGQF